MELNINVRKLCHIYQKHGSPGGLVVQETEEALLQDSGHILPKMKNMEMYLTIAAVQMHRQIPTKG